MERIIGRVMMKSLFLRGFSRITLRLGGSEASASAAKVSMIRLTHSICVTVSGSSLPKIEPSSTMTIATKLIVSWNRTKRWMLRYSERPHMTAVAMLLNESSSSVMSLASLATDVPDAHRQADLREIQRRSVVRPVARHGHHLAPLLQAGGRAAACRAAGRAT